MRRDLYDLAHERARTAALETELKYLKASAGPATIAYEVVPPVQNDDIASPAVDVGTDVQVHFTQSASLVDTPVDNTAVLSTCFAVDMTQPSTSVHAPDIAYAFLQPVRPHAADTYTTYSSALQPLSILPHAGPTRRIRSTSHSYRLGLRRCRRLQWLGSPTLLAIMVYFMQPSYTFDSTRVDTSSSQLATTDEIVRTYTGQRAPTAVGTWTARLVSVYAC